MKISSLLKDLRRWLPLLSLNIAVIVVGIIVAGLLLWNLLACDEFHIVLALFVGFWAYLVWYALKREEGQI